MNIAVDELAASSALSPKPDVHMKSASGAPPELEPAAGTLPFPLPVPTAAWSKAAVPTGVGVPPDANDPVVKGDLLRCPFRQGGPNFDKDSQPRFYFLGQKPTNRYYTLGELEKKIDEFGGKVLKELTVEVDYVVVIGKGDEDLKNYEKAVQFGASFMREDELLDYIGK